MYTNLIAAIAVSITLLTASAGAVTMLPGTMSANAEPTVLMLDLD